MQKASIKEVLNGSDDTKFVTPKSLSKYFSTKQTGGGDGVDTLPIGSIVEYDGDTVPVGYEEFTDSKVLYDNMDGYNGNITLSDSAENYKYIDIFYRNEAHIHSSVRVYAPNEKKVVLMSMTQNNDGPYMGVYFRNKIVLISGNSINHYLSSQCFITGNNVCGLNLDATVLTFITRVVGYR